MLCNGNYLYLWDILVSVAGMLHGMNSECICSVLVEVG